MHRTRYAAAAALIATSAAALPAGSAQGVQTDSEPCTALEYRQFDFWVGEWTVTQGDKVVGRNRIEPILGACALLENWVSASGSAGRSLNFYDRATGKWHQTWIDASGEPLLLDGTFSGGAMRLQGVRPGEAKGSKLMHRITWTPLPSGQVRQFWETSSNGGKQWEVAFDGTYTRDTVAE